MGRAPRDVTVAVIIPTYCRARLITQSVDSILGQTRAPDEVIVVDDGSTDDTVATIARYDGRVRYLYQENAGKPAAVNLALSQATADYIWVMDDDDVAAADALERHLVFLRRNPGVDFTYSGLYAFDGSKPPPPPEQCRLWQYPDVPRDRFLIHVMEHAQPNHQTMLVPRRCYEAVGPLKENLTFCEDYDIVLRLARRYVGARLDRPTIFYREHPGGRGPARERYAASERKRGWLIYEKKIFTELYASLPLDEYLPRRQAGHSLTPSEKRLALLQRACIMAHHGVYEAALDDLEAAIGSTGDAYTLEEQAMCRRMMTLNPLLTGRQAFTRSAARLLRERAPVLFAAIAKGYLWRSRRSFSSGDFRGAIGAGVQLLRLAGTRARQA